MELSKANTSTPKVKQEDDPDATECSSSFGDSFESGRENVSATNDVEVESHFCNVNDDFGFDGHENSLLFPTRKKKLTAHWRNFIRPLMWRCKWAELKMKDIQSQASKYDKELAAYEERKKIEQDQLKVSGFASKSSLWTSSSRMAHRKIMKRRKRKRVEDSLDTESYMSRHCLFSYHENKNSNLDEEIVCKPEQNDNAHSEINTNEDWLFHNSKDDLEPILLKIENLQARVRKLKSGLVSVISENPSSSCAISPTLAAENCHDVAVPDITESTDGLLSSVDITLPRTQIRDTSEAIMDNVQLHNRVVTETGESSKKAIKNNKQSKKPSEAKLSKIAASTSNISLKSRKFEEQHLNSEARSSKIAASTSNLSLKNRKFEEKHLNSEAKSSKIAASTSNLSLKNLKFEEKQQSNSVNPGLDQVTSLPKAKRKRGERKPGCGHGWNR